MSAAGTTPLMARPGVKRAWKRSWIEDSRMSFAGLDPAIHLLRKLTFLRLLRQTMDARVKPAHNKRGLTPLCSLSCHSPRELSGRSHSASARRMQPVWRPLDSPRRELSHRDRLS